MREPAGDSGEPIDYVHLYRSLIRKGRVQPSEVGRLTISQALAILDDSDPRDPHRGNVPINSLDQLAELCGVDT